MFQKVMGQKESEPAVTPSAPPAAAQPQAAPASQPAAASSQRNILSSDVEIKGTVKFSSDLLVDGKIDGQIQSDGSLTIGENAVIKAEIKTKSVVIYGKVHGNIVVSDRVELKGNAELVGDITASTLSIEAGAIFVGKSTVGSPKLTPKSSSTPAPAASTPAPTAKETPSDTSTTTQA